MARIVNGHCGAAIKNVDGMNCHVFQSADGDGFRLRGISITILWRRLDASFVLGKAEDDGDETTLQCQMTVLTEFVPRLPIRCISSHVFVSILGTGFIFSRLFTSAIFLFHVYTFCKLDAIHASKTCKVNLSLNVHCRTPTVPLDRGPSIHEPVRNPKVQ